MHIRFPFYAFIFLLIYFSENIVFSQPTTPEGIYIIFDASGSMWGKLSDQSTKIESARNVLEQFVRQDFSGKELALRAYGHRREKDCTDSELLVPFGSQETVSTEFLRQIKNINPKGRTPISYSFREALKDFGDRSGDIILISDGIETCDEDPCALMRIWKDKNVSIRVHIVGLGVEEEARLALECMATAAGTEYHHAESAIELAEGLRDIQKLSGSSGVHLIGRTAEGKELKVKGVLSQPGKISTVIESNHRNQVPAGVYTLEAGVETSNGQLYLPTKTEVTIPDGQDKTLTVTVSEPPMIWAEFQDAALKVKGALIYAYQNNQVVFSFRPIDTVYVNPGAYEFRTKPNSDNDLSLTATLKSGEKRAIVFAMIHTVKVIISMTASESGLLFRSNYELWQNGEKKYDVHRANGSLVLPGTYDIKLPLALTPYTEKNTIINPTDELQKINVVVPCGHVTVIYQKPDGSQDKDDRCWISLDDGKGLTFHNSGQKYALTPGKYQLTGWSQKGNYDPIRFEIKVGETKTLILRAK